MPKQAEIAVVTVNGRKFDDWDSVRVERRASDAITHCQLSVTEKVGGKLTFQSLRLKPGDKANVTLAGRKVCNGVVTTRQAAYSATSHGVLVVIESQTIDLVDSSAPLKTSQFKDKTLKEIAEKLAEPFGVKITIRGSSKAVEKKFKDVSINPGESVWSVIDGLARQRGMQVHDDEDGNLVLATGTQGVGGDLVEGKNILSANCMIQDRSEFGSIGAQTQQRGDDKTDDETARKPAASVSGGADRHRPLTVLAEEPGDAEDMKTRVEHERNALAAAIINARVVVRGWLKPGGGLWKEREVLTVNSPMLLLDNVKLGVNAVVFSQDGQSGTTTMLELVKPEAMGAIGAGDPNLPGGSSREAEVEV